MRYPTVAEYVVGIGLALVLGVPLCWLGANWVYGMAWCFPWCGH